MPSHPNRRHPRLATFDSHTPGYYFITICTQDRLVLFGSIESGEMRLTPAGQMVDAAWEDIARLHPGVTIDAHITMPDHVHAIVVLEDDPRRTLSLSDVVQRYKSLTTKRYAQGVKEHGWPRFRGKLWQESFYDHVIRDDEKLDRVRRYITENPLRRQLRIAQTQVSEGM